jgi:polysaccharide deacetylase family sporulation protein PdaB
VKKSTIIRAVVFIVLLAAAIIYTQVIAADSEPVMNVTENEMPVCSVETEDQVVAITIDTAFGDDYTDEILKVLKEKNVKATFFILGMWAEKNPAKADAIARAGQDIANHSMNHKRYTEMTPEEIIKDVTQAKMVIKTTTGKESMIVRMPYGAFNDESIAALKEEGYIPVKWSLDSMDWKQPGKDAVKDNVINNLKKGSIIIFQNNMADTPQALTEILDEIKARDYKCVTLSEMMLNKDYIVDESGTQKPLAD